MKRDLNFFAIDPELKSSILALFGFFREQVVLKFGFLPIEGLILSTGWIDRFHDRVSSFTPANKVDFLATATAKWRVIAVRICDRSNRLVTDWAFWQADQGY